jgi:Flp pilus assembly protein TadB
LAHGFLLQLPSLNVAYKWVQPVSAISIALLVALISAALIFDLSGDWLWRSMTVVAIVVVLCSALIPILLRLGASTARVKLVLELLENGVYQSADGKRFEVRELE